VSSINFKKYTLFVPVVERNRNFYVNHVYQIDSARQTTRLEIARSLGENETDIDEKDIRTDVYRASGAGGQHVNKTESAVRLTHEPSGIVVTCQDGRDQRSNKDKAMKVLKSKIYAMEEEKRQQEVEGSRKDQLGSGDRSEKIRTYNFPQNRLTDHRIGWSSQNLSNIMSSGDLDNLIEALILDNQQKISEKEKQKIG
jgi:peptide chain release factor 1